MMITRRHTLPTKPCAKCGGSSRSCEGKLPVPGSKGSIGGVRDTATFSYEWILAIQNCARQTESWLTLVNSSILMMCPTTDCLFFGNTTENAACLYGLGPEVTFQLSKVSPNWVSPGKLWTWNSGKAVAPAWGRNMLKPLLGRRMWKRSVAKHFFWQVKVQ